MRKIVPVVIGLFSASTTFGQEMPSVFDKSLARSDNQLKKVESLASGDLMVIGGGVSGAYFAKLDANGKIIFETKNEKNKNPTISYNDIVITGDSSALVVGGGIGAHGAGRISFFDKKGNLIFDKIYGGNSGGYFTKVKQDHAGNFVAVGVDGSSPSRSRITKVNAKGDVLFDKLCTVNTVFNDLVLEDDDSFIAIGGDAGDSRGHGLLVKLTSTGDKVYEIVQPGSGGSKYTNGVLMDDGSLLVIGGGLYGSGNSCRATRVRVDGQIIFDKTYSDVDGRFNTMSLDYRGDIVASAEELDRGRIIKLRPDGTVIFNKITTSPVVDLKINTANQILAVGSKYNTLESKDNTSELFKLSTEGKNIFVDGNRVSADDKTISGITVPGVLLNNLLLSDDGKIYATSSKSYRILKFDDNTGDTIFDKEYGKIGSSAMFTSIRNLPSGEIVAIGGGIGDGNRITKISHGASINDVTILEPLKESSTAKLTISLTGFLLKDGVQQPVTISYKSLFNNKVVNGDITPIDGVISFVPSDFSQGEAIVKTIELPVHSDQILEGTEKVTIELSNATNTHLSRRDGVVTIEEPEAFIRFVSGSDAIEGKSLGYTVGLFKSDGTALINQTGFPIKIKYKFGPGSANPKTDFDAKTTNPLVINNGESIGSISIKTIEDSFYKDAQSVQLVLQEVNCSKSSVIEFLGKAKTLSLIQYINDIGAEVMISKITDRNRTGDYANGMFKISLVKASNGSQVTNCSGGDIQVQFVVDSSSTAIAGKDFVIMSGGGVSISGGCGGVEADIKVICIPRSVPSNTGPVSILLNLTKVTGSSSTGGPLSISSKNKATAFILDK